MNVPSYTAEEILDQLDDCARAFTFPMLDNGYVYPADVRLTGFRDDTRWALIIEFLGANPRAGDHDSIDDCLHCFGNCLRRAPGTANEDFLSRTADGDNGPTFDSEYGCNLFLALALVFALSREGASQAAYLPDSVIVRSGPLLLHALLWQPPGAGPFPAILVNPGSYLANEPLQPDDPGALGPVFCSQGYVCLVLFRRGGGPSADQGPPEGELMGRAMAEHAQTGRNRVQLELLEGEALNEALAGLAYLRSLPAVDPVRIAVVGHSFGGSLSILLAARDSTIRAAVLFGATAGSWDSSPELQGRLLAAVHEARASMFFIHAANDYSVAPGKALAAELKRVGKTHRLKIYPPFGSTTRAGHNLVFRSVNTWQRDVLSFLKTSSVAMNVSPHGTARLSSWLAVAA